MKLVVFLVAVSWLPVSCGNANEPIMRVTSVRSTDSLSQAEQRFFDSVKREHPQWGSRDHRVYELLRSGDREIVVCIAAFDPAIVPGTRVRTKTNWTALRQEVTFGDEAARSELQAVEELRLLE